MAASTAPDYSRLKVLVVEDNHHMRTIITTILTGAGFQSILVREVRDGAEALDLLRQFDADFALVDYNMSPIDGVEFTKLLRNASDSSNKFLPIIMVSGHSEKSRVTQARDAGVNEFIIKPLTAKALMGRIKSIVAHPRPYVKCRNYLGPDRRRKVMPDYQGPFRRDSDGLI